MSTKNIYGLPALEKDIIDIISDPRAHFAHFEHAIDFCLPTGCKVLASFDGEVIDVKVDSNQGGSDPKYADLKYQNHITLKHPNEEFSQYVHLQFNGSLVRVGDKVIKGQVIGKSGNAGFSNEPHLHFMVFTLSKSSPGWKSLEVSFDQKILVDKSMPKLSNRELELYLKNLKKELK